MLMEGLGRVLFGDPIFPLTCTHLGAGQTKRCAHKAEETPRRMMRRKKTRGRWGQVMSSCVSSH